MELRHLKSFLLAAETLSISAAARRLHITQPALSRQIRDLEAEVGQPLFLRHPAGLKLTPAGREMQARGAGIIAAHDEALRAARGQGAPPVVHLRLGYAPTLHMWTRFMAPAMTRLEGRLPRVTCTVREMTSGRMLAALGAGEIDAALLGAGVLPSLPGIRIDHVCDLPAALVVAADHPLAKKRHVEIEDLRGEEIIGFSEEAFPGRDITLRERCHAAGFEPRIHRVGENLLDGISVGLRRGALGIAANLGMRVFVPGVVFVPFRAPGVPMPLFAASTEAVPASGQLCELMAAEAERVARSLWPSGQPFWDPSADAPAIARIAG